MLCMVISLRPATLSAREFENCVAGDRWGVSVWTSSDPKYHYGTCKDCGGWAKEKHYSFYVDSDGGYRCSNCEYLFSSYKLVDSITVDFPKAGEPLPNVSGSYYTPYEKNHIKTTSSDAIANAEIRWRDSNGLSIKTPEFELGTTYRYEILLTVKKGYYLDGKTDIKTGGSIKSTTFIKSHTKVEITGEYTVKNLITSVNVTGIQYPRARDLVPKPEQPFTGTVSLSPTNSIESAIISWYDSGRKPIQTETFEEGTTYLCSMILKANSTSYWDLFDTTVKVDGTPLINIFDIGEDATEWKDNYLPVLDCMIVSMQYTVPELTPITNIDLQVLDFVEGNPLPSIQAGELSIGAGKDMHHDKANVILGNKIKSVSVKGWRDNSQQPVDHSEILSEKRYYNGIVLTPGDGYKFVENCTITRYGEASPREYTWTNLIHNGDLVIGFGTTVKHTNHVTTETEWEKDDFYHWRRCDRCTEVFDEFRHSYGDFVPGPETSKTHTCTVCGFVQSVPNEALAIGRVYVKLNGFMQAGNPLPSVKLDPDSEVTMERVSTSGNWYSWTKVEKGENGEESEVPVKVGDIITQDQYKLKMNFGVKGNYYFKGSNMAVRGIDRYGTYALAPTKPSNPPKTQEATWSYSVLPVVDVTVDYPTVKAGQKVSDAKPVITASVDNAIQTYLDGWAIINEEGTAESIDNPDTVFFEEGKNYLYHIYQIPVADNRYFPNYIVGNRGNANKIYDPFSLFQSIFYIRADYNIPEKENVLMASVKVDAPTSGGTPAAKVQDMGTGYQVTNVS